jgi:hypothetical protein
VVSATPDFATVLPSRSPQSAPPGIRGTAGRYWHEAVDSIRGDLERCLIVQPGGLVEQWQEEMWDKFGLHIEILTRDQIEASVTGNPFAEKARLITRLNMTARSD